MGIEIERKFLIKEMPNLNEYESKKLVQGYLSTKPTVRVRREDDEYYLTYKGAAKDNIARTEYNLPLTKESYEHLLEKADGNIISKTRYLIPLGKNSRGNELVGELDVFDPPFAPMHFIEVEFESMEEAEEFVLPDWFGEDVSDCREYYNSYMSQIDFSKK